MRRDHASGPVPSFDDAVGRVPLLKFLTIDQREHLRPVASIQQSHQGQPVWAIEEPTDAYIFLVAGHVKLLRAREDGRDVILDIRGPGEVLCVGAVSAAAPYCCSAQVISEEAVWVALPRRAVDGILETSAPAAVNFMRQASSHEMRLTGRVVELASGQVEQRLATLLLRLADQLGVKDAGGRVRIPVRLSRQDLADLCGTTLESAIRTMTAFARDGAAATLADGFTVDRRALEELARGRAR